MTKINLDDLKTPQSRNVIAKEKRRGNPRKRILTGKIQLGLTEEEMNKIIEKSEEQGATYSHMVRTLLRQAGVFDEIYQYKCHACGSSAFTWAGSCRLCSQCGESDGGCG